MDIVFNELSVTEERISERTINAAVSCFLEVYSKVIKRDISISRSLITSVDINSLTLSVGYSIAQWRNSSLVDRDEKRRLLGLCDRQRIVEPIHEDVQYVEFESKQGKGLQIAYEKQSPLISIPLEGKWKRHVLFCDLIDITFDERIPIEIKNIYCEESLNEHGTWIEGKIEKEYQAIKNSTDFLNMYSSLFPSLVFHTNALSQVKNQLSETSIQPLVKKLSVLERYFSSWNGEVFDRDAFPPRFISPESTETLSRFKNEHTFEMNGEMLLFSYHVRYTGGDVPGRIYIYPHKGQKKCYICSLYTKLPTVSDPKFKKT